MAAATNPRRIVGNWISGRALDIHTVSSTRLGLNESGHDVFDAKRSELGELPYRIKYHGDLSAAPEIVEAAVAFLKRSRVGFDVIVPVPPSGKRLVQPVLVLATAIGKALNCRFQNVYPRRGPQRN